MARGVQRRPGMEDRNSEKSEEQLEHHSLPGTNMAGKGPGDECEARAEQNSSRAQRNDNDNERRPDDQPSDEG